MDIDGEMSGESKRGTASLRERERDKESERVCVYLQRRGFVQFFFVADCIVTVPTFAPGEFDESSCDAKYSRAIIHNLALSHLIRTKKPNSTFSFCSVLLHSCTHRQSQRVQRAMVFAKHSNYRPHYPDTQTEVSRERCKAKSCRGRNAEFRFLYESFV